MIEHLQHDTVVRDKTRIVQCPDCGQMEIWSEDEAIDHGRCRTGQYPCACDDDRANGLDTTTVADLKGTWTR